MGELLGPQGAVYIIWMTWRFQCLGAAVIALPFFVAYLVYQYHLESLYVGQEKREKELEAEIAIAQASQPKERPLTVYRRENAPEDKAQPPVPRSGVPPVSDMGRDKYDQGGLSVPFSESPPSNEIRINESLFLPKMDLIYFIESALRDSGPGLAIGRWKREEKWAQEHVEAVLDMLAEMGFITERRNGVACEWIGNPDRTEILKKISERE